jgi:23S rRNA pseudouridine1911/1915/1917 synthase
MRADAFVLLQYPHFSRSYVKMLFASHAVCINGRPVPKSHRMLAGMECSISSEYLWRAEAVPLANSNIGLHVLWEDADVLAVHKPAGIPTHPLHPHEQNTLCNALVAYDPSLRGVGYGPLEPGIVHRLDTETSGVVLVARNAASFAFLKHSFQTHQVAKYYCAVVYGAWEGHHVVCADLQPEGLKGFKMKHVPQKDMLSSTRTEIWVKETSDTHACVEVLIHQGVRHQIRAHLALLGHPIVGDLVYAHADEHQRRVHPRHLLHALRVEWIHPKTGEKMCTVSDSGPLFKL